ncbi:hypothetical protein GCM10022239_03270 [Leifsonia bigeumensis]|uniref:M23ase beta-sheet core domain-containing protein n=1 Tax=Leifsonella bigeumensis TaxID=433643 RepID=A0ABP7F238_9MICO
MLTARPTPAGRQGRPDHGISAPFGRSPQYFDGTRVHHGQDYYWLNADPAGSRRVFAAGAGTVSRVYWDATMGGCIEVNHGSFITRYCHMPQGSAAVKVGQAVTTSTYLGPMGNAGTAANGQNHLHFEVWKNGARVDPEPYFRMLGPNQRQVLATASVNRRAEPTTLAEKIGSAAAGSILTLTGWRHGVEVQGIDEWVTDGNGWMWLGGFTDTGVHDLADLTPPPVIEPPVIEPTEPPVVIEPPAEPDPPIEPTEPAPPVELPDPPVEDEQTPPVTTPSTSTVNRTGVLIVSGFIAIIATVGTIMSSCGGPS